MKTRTLTLLSVVLLFSAGCVLLYQAGFRLNTGISYPGGLYRLTDATPAYHKGELVLFCPPDNAAMRVALERRYINPGRCPGGFTPVIKKVMTTGGDRVTFDNVVRINTRPVPSAVVLVMDSKGRRLPHMGPVTLHDDQYLMLSDHRPVVSFDSRYYGPVDGQKVIGHIHPVFTW